MQSVLRAFRRSLRSLHGVSVVFRVQEDPLGVGGAGDGRRARRHRPLRRRERERGRRRRGGKPRQVGAARRAPRLSQLTSLVAVPTAQENSNNNLLGSRKWMDDHSGVQDQEFVNCRCSESVGGSKRMNVALRGANEVTVPHLHAYHVAVVPNHL